jgi:hypothetical protein
MEKDEEYDNSKEPKKFHSLISAKVRCAKTQKKEKLIELVVKEKLTIYRAAKRLKICHPTAKFIMKNYRKNKEVKVEEGRLGASPGQGE